MSIIKLKEANCKNCYKCIRECPVKSISFSKEQAQIIDKECVLCGHCLLACPQHAKEIVSDVDRVRALTKNNKVYVSLAPSYPSYFKGVSIGQISAALKKLGVTQVEETAVGAAKVSEQYEEIMKNREMKNIITTACPSVVLLVEKHFPDLIPYLAPVVSPVLAHAKAMKEVYGSRVKVVFVGPCIAKKHDVEDPTNGGLLSAALSFEELEEWMRAEGVSFGEEEEQRGLRKPVARFYPVPGGILKTLDPKVRKLYKCTGIDGMQRCIDVLKSMRRDEFSGYFLEMNACTGACIGGPSLEHACYFTSKDQLMETIGTSKDETHYLSDETTSDISHKYIDLTAHTPLPSEEQIRAILAKIGKTKKEDELNCGGCGYPSCRDKAIAVIRGKAELQMCMPYVRQKAESMANTIIDCSPNSILALDEALTIHEANPAACEMIKMSRKDLIGRHIEDILPCDMYYDMFDEEHDAIKVAKQAYEQYGVVVEQTVVYVKKSDSLILIIKDITQEEESKQKEKHMREGTIEITQKVIEKQMRVAQEIASLLGETTAETKVALTKLKKSMEEGGEKA